MVDLVVAISVLFVLAVGLTVAWWSWLSRSMTRRIDALTRSLKMELIESQSSHLEQVAAQLRQLPEPVELDIAPLVDRLLKVEKTLAGNTRLAADQQKSINQRLDSLTEAIENIPYPLGPKPVNLTPVYDRFQSIDAQLASLGKMIDRATLQGAQREAR